MAEDTGPRKTNAKLTAERDKLAGVFKDLDDVGNCCTWLIEFSSEGCKIAIAGVPVLLANQPDGGGMKAFVDKQKPAFKHK